MTPKLVGENFQVDIGKLLGLKVKSFSDDVGPGEFSLVGKKLFFSTPVMELGDDYEASVTITYLNKKGRAVTHEFDFIVADNDAIPFSTFVGSAGPNSYINNTSKNVLAYGLGGNDVIKPGTGDDRLFGGSGDDELYGYQGKDQLAGEDGNDTLYAGTEDDVLDGGEGDDVLWSHGGNDVIIGGAGIDSFAILTGDGADVITDFVAGVDKVYFDEVRFNESQFAAIATETANGTLLTFDANTTVLLEGFFL
jgi:Ca2+-binding RTX toxin-like protein